MRNDPILRLLGLAKKAGRLEMGEEPVGAACRARQAKLVLLARDAAPNTRRRAAHFGETGGVLWLELPFSKSELGFVLGRATCAMLAVTDAGFGAAVVEKLAAQDPARYGPAAQQLRARADRVLQRQREQRQHEKNLRQGKRKPWAPAPPKEGQSPPQPGKRSPGRADRPPKEGPKRTPGPNSGRPGRGGPARPKGTTERNSPAGRRLTGKFRKP